ncbi:exonuclease from phage origin [Escherichia coli]|nr:exonuclease from phage origin [Escherichia coli]
MNGRGSPARGVTPNDRDVRTMVALGLVMDFDARTTIPFEGERHNALHDARYQANTFQPSGKNCSRVRLIFDVQPISPPTSYSGGGHAVKARDHMYELTLSPAEIKEITKYERYQNSNTS